MGSVLIAMSRLEDAQKIATLIRRQGMPFEVIVCETGAEILRNANDRDYGVVICGKRIRDMDYSELSQMLPELFGMILLTKDVSIEVFIDHTVKLSIPFRTGDLINTINMITENFYRRIRKKKKAPPARSEEDRKCIDEAKHLLMERNGLSEEEAFRYIQKTSMDVGRKMTESAKMILTLYND